MVLSEEAFFGALTSHVRRTTARNGRVNHGIEIYTKIKDLTSGMCGCQG